MHFHRRLFLEALRLALFTRPFRLRRWLYVLFFSALLLFMLALVELGRALDHLLFPGFRRVEVREPFFIVAPPRSGTTLTQKLLSLDEERFVHSKLYQTIFPCILYQKLIRAAARLDRLLGRPLERLVSFAEQRFFGGWDDKHPLRFGEPEEDDGYFVYTFVTEAIYLLFPYVDELWEAGFADALLPAERARLMRYYEGCLQRQIYVNGREKTILAKATQASGSVRCLLEAFPDARFVTILRHPAESVPSHVSVFYPVWRAHSPEIAKDGPTARSYARLALAWYRHLLDMEAQIDPACWYLIEYPDLVADPAAAVLRIYAHFGWEPSPEFRERLAAAGRREESFRSAHRYSLEEYGLSRGWIEEQIDDVLEARGLLP